MTYLRHSLPNNARDRRSAQASACSGDSPHTSQPPPSPPRNIDTRNNSNTTTTVSVQPALSRPLPLQRASPCVRGWASPTFNKYDVLGVQYGTLHFEMVPDPWAPRIRQSVPWQAFLIVRCLDVSRLMDEGFFWSVDNLVNEEGCILPVSDPAFVAVGYSHMRTWSLTDRSERRGGNRTPKWVAYLEVPAHAVETLAAFRPQNLTIANVWKADAWDVRGNTIYNYDVYHPAQNFNCIYDEKPLQGWWPWPREKSELQARSWECIPM